MNWNKKLLVFCGLHSIPAARCIEVKHSSPVSPATTQCFSSTFFHFLGDSPFDCKVFPGEDITGEPHALRKYNNPTEQLPLFFFFFAFNFLIPFGSLFEFFFMLFFLFLVLVSFFFSSFSCIQWPRTVAGNSCH